MNVKHLQNDIFLPEAIRLLDEDNGHTVSMTARGNSMMPFVRHNRDLLVFVRKGAVKVGDVVLAEITKGRFVCHRIISLNGAHIVMRGDGNVRGVEHCQLADVRARLQSVVRNGKTYDLSTSRAWKLYSALWPKQPFLRRVLLPFFRVLYGMPLLGRNVSLQ